MGRFEFISAAASERLDTAVQHAFERDPTAAQLENVPSRSQVKGWIEQGLVTVNGRVATKAGLQVDAGAAISVAIPDAKPLALYPDRSIPFTIIYEDEDLLVIDKPAGVVVHPGAGRREESTLLHGLLAHLGDNLLRIGDKIRPGIVHRLDKDTSGLMVVAKSELAYRVLSKAFLPPRAISRTYLAIVGRLPRKNAATAKSPEGWELIELPIARHPTQRTKMSVAKSGGRPSITKWRVRESFPFGHLLELSLETGRTHQIRVHLEACTAPILGDKTYSRSSEIPKRLQSAAEALGRQALHAYRLEFDHPRTGKALIFESPLPADMNSLIQTLKQFTLR